MLCHNFWLVISCVSLRCQGEQYVACKASFLHSFPVFHCFVLCVLLTIRFVNIFYLRQGGYVFVIVCLSLCLSVCLTVSNFEGPNLV